MSYKSRQRYAKYCKDFTVSFGNYQTTNYRSLEVMNSNMWKSKIQINKKRIDLNNFDINKETDCIKFLDMLKALVKQITRLNQAKSTEVWQRVTMTEDEKYMYQVLFDFVQSCNLATNDGLKRKASERFDSRMIGWYNRLVAKIGKIDNEKQDKEKAEKIA